MKITFLGAAQTVTGSQHLIEVDERQILLDCGLFQGHRKEAHERNLNFAFDPAKLAGVVLSHAHIDHCGNLPNLVKQGFRGPIYATHVTAHLAEIMLLDSAHIQEADAAYLNKKDRKGEPPVEPLYTQADAMATVELLRGQPYDQPFEVVLGVRGRFVEAGHIMGSASVVLEVEEAGRRQRLWFSGDIGRLKLPLVRDPVLPEEADALIMECTYGNRSHADPEEAFDELREVVRRTAERQGKIIVPAFALGRTQEIVYGMNQMMAAGEIPRLPVYVDSPLAVRASQIFSEHPEYFDAQAQAFMRSAQGRSALGFDLLRYVQSVEESKALNGKGGPMMIIAASGMAETGRILHHLKNNIEDRRNTVLMVSWQAPNTLGRQLVEGAQEVKIFGEMYWRRAEVKEIGGLSAHAGQEFLLEYGLAVKGRAKRVFLVHGEAEGAEALMGKMRQAGLEGVEFPKRGTEVEV
jgi:metallo-beta-lactamase family protein